MRLVRSAVMILGCCAVYSLVVSPVLGGNDIELATFEEPVFDAPQQSVTNIATPPARVRTILPSAPRFLVRPAFTPAAPTMPGRMSAAPRTARLARRSPKPFENIEHEPTISPYLLDREEDDFDDIPTYLTFIRPRFEQIHTNRLQQRALHRLDGQVQNISLGSGVVPQSNRAGGVADRFMNTGQFFGGN
jgi:hypothetical protein